MTRGANAFQISGVCAPLSFFSGRELSGLPKFSEKVNTCIRSPSTQSLPFSFYSQIFKWTKPPCSAFSLKPYPPLSSSTSSCVWMTFPARRSWAELLQRAELGGSPWKPRAGGPRDFNSAVTTPQLISGLCLSAGGGVLSPFLWPCRRIQPWVEWRCPHGRRADIPFCNSKVICFKYFFKIKKKI